MAISGDREPPLPHPIELMKTCREPDFTKLGLKANAHDEGSPAKRVSSKGIIGYLLSFIRLSKQSFTVEASFRDVEQSISCVLDPSGLDQLRHCVIECCRPLRVKIAIKLLALP